MNLDRRTVDAFGAEWSTFDQSSLDPMELQEHFDKYFKVFSWSDLPHHATGFDLGCGSGRWALLVAPRVGTLHCIDASEDALNVARSNLAHLPNCTFHHGTLETLPLEDESMDFGYAIGVLHHVPDTEAGIRCAVKKLKPGAQFLIYLYYAFDNRPGWFRAVWRISDGLRRLISKWPHRAKVVVTTIIASLVYWPLARGARVVERAGFDVDVLPLSIYRRRSFYSMKTDALDRFGTPLEQRFTQVQIEQMMQRAGLEDVVFSDSPPYWCCVGRKRR